MIRATVIADSITYSGARLTTFCLVYPRFIHAQLLTHRSWSRNSASSRAIPPGKFRDLVVKDTAMPLYYGQNKKGMQADVEVSDVAKATNWWLKARDIVLGLHQEGEAIGLHKQILNRILEPFQLITTLVTATEFQNFFDLRLHEDAQPEMKELARKMQDSLFRSVPKTLDPEEWHLPFSTALERTDFREGRLEDLPMVTAARCARVSYLTHDGKRDTEEDIRLSNQLLLDAHMSPFEHVAQAMPDLGQYANFTGFRSYRYLMSKF